MTPRILGLGFALALCACGLDDLHRMRGVPQGKLVVGLGMTMREVEKRSTVKLRKLPALGSSSGSYADGNAYFDLELQGTGLRFAGCSMYSIDYEGPDETVRLVNACITPGRSRWSAYQRELGEAAAKLKADGWTAAAVDGQPTIEAFLARDGSRPGGTDSGRIAVFESRKGPSSIGLAANRAWDSDRFWSMLHLSPTGGPESAETERWLEEFQAYPYAQYVCRQHVSGAGEGAMHINWTLYISRDEPEQVAAFYAASGGAPGPEGSTLTLASKDGLKHVSVHRVGDDYPRCGVDPPAFARTVFVVSQASRR